MAVVVGGTARFRGFQQGAEHIHKEKMEELTGWSMDYLRGMVFERYGRTYQRPIFTEDTLWKDPESVLQEYPISLSTTFSSRTGLKEVLPAFSNVPDGEIGIIAPYRDQVGAMEKAVSIPSTSSRAERRMPSS